MQEIDAMSTRPRPHLPRRSTSDRQRPAAGAQRTQARTPFDAQTFLDTVDAGRHLTKYKRGEMIFLQGDPADAVYYVQKGKVQITVLSDLGKEGVIAVLNAGEFFGEGCLAGQRSHISTASAATTSVIAKIDIQVMSRILHDAPALPRMFMSFLLARNVEVEAELIGHIFNTSEKRLAQLLLTLANIGEEGKTEKIPKISQELLASRIGTNRTRVNFFMNKFRRLGFIDYERSGALSIHSSLANVIVHG